MNPAPSAMGVLAVSFRLYKYLGQTKFALKAGWMHTWNGLGLHISGGSIYTSIQLRAKSTVKMEWGLGMDQPSTLFEAAATQVGLQTITRKGNPTP
jgi:hypothetical protein